MNLVSMASTCRSRISNRVSDADKGERQRVSKQTKQSIDFENSIAELESLVEKMEQGEFSLEDSIKQFERGITLARSCQKALREAEQKVMRLVGGSDEQELKSIDLAQDPADQ